MNETSPNAHYCPSCGTQLTNQVDTCLACGQALCPACGLKVDENATRCLGCGAVFEMTCPDCGAPLKPEDVRCARCGAVFQTTTAAQPTEVVAPPATLSEQTQQAHLYALTQLRAKADPSQVEEQLVASGLPRSTAGRLLRTLLTTRRQADRTAGKYALITGGLWAGGGLAITLLGRALAGERGGSYFILWGAVIIGALQFVRGLAQFLSSASTRSNWDNPLESDSLLDADQYGWPMPQQNKATWLGIIAFLGLMAVLSFASLGPPLVDKTAAQLNLSEADLGAEFNLAEEAGLDPADAKDMRDFNRRYFTQEDSVVISSVLIGHQRWDDDPADLLKSFASADATTLTWGEITPVNIGKRAALRSFSADTPNGSRTGYALAFVQDNVIVILFEGIGADQSTTETVQAHARVIESRLH